VSEHHQSEEDSGLGAEGGVERGIAGDDGLFQGAVCEESAGGSEIGVGRVAALESSAVEQAAENATKRRKKLPSGAEAR